MKPSLAKFEKIAYKLDGNIVRIAKAFKVVRRTVNNWVEADPEFKEIITDARESCVDVSESQLMKNVRAGKEASVFFHLKTQGKSRGYVERQEFTDIIPFQESKEDIKEHLDKIRANKKKYDFSEGENLEDE